MKKNETLFQVTAPKEECFGDYMSKNFVSLQAGSTVKQAMRSLLSQAEKSDNIEDLFVVDALGRYQGAIELKRLILAREDTPFATLVDPSHPFVLADRPIDENIEALKNFAAGTLPVLDEEHRLLGAISVEGMLEILDNELGEDYARLGGLTEEETLQEPLGRSVAKRLPWLALLLILGLFVSSVIGVFERVIQGLTVIVCFQSLILGMAGNGGTQTLAVTVRMLSDVALTGKTRRQLLSKEIRIAICNGMVLGLLSVALIGCYLIWQGTAVLFAFSVSGCIGLALCLAMVLSAVAGTLIPLIFQQIGIDPAVASGPLITTINDLSAVVIYYGLAWLLLL